MSEMEHHRGKIQEVYKLSGETLEEQCKRIIESLYFKVKLKDYELYTKYIIYEMSEEYIVIKDTLFRFFEHVKIEPDEFLVEQIDSCSFSFSGGFYNGSTCLNEVLEEEITKLM